MTSLYIEATRSTPEIKFENHILTVKGQSYPENAVGFYAPIFSWLNEYLGMLGEVTAIFQFDLLYMNTSSSKCIMDFVDILQGAYRQGKRVSINWYYDPENESLLECAEEFKEDVDLPFNIIPLEG